METESTATVRARAGEALSDLSQAIAILKLARECSIGDTSHGLEQEVIDATDAARKLISKAYLPLAYTLDYLPQP